MNLSKKTFGYSCIVSIVVILLLIGYFIFMLPSLYVAHIENNNLQIVKEIHQSFIDGERYEVIKNNNPVTTYIFDIPKSGNTINIYNKFANLTLTLTDKQLLSIFDKLKSRMNDNNEDKDYSEFYEEFVEKLKSTIDQNNLPFEVKIENVVKDDGFEKLSSKSLSISDDTFIFQNNTRDQNNYYTTYLGFTNREDDIVITMLPTMTPQIDEIKPVVLQSLPTILGVAILIVLISTIYLSKKIVKPIVALSNDAANIKDNLNLNIEPIVFDSNDEIESLSRTLKELFTKLNEAFSKLNDQNVQLKKQNERAEVFLRASSHQLKTPVAASLLLTDGMINEVGKFKNTKEYLPKLKEQILSMRKIIDDILNINKVVKNLTFTDVNVCELVENTLYHHNISIQDKEINLNKSLNEVIYKSDWDLLYKIIDNLVNNAVKYTANEGKIDIVLNNSYLKILNYGSHINEDILPHIFEAFVSSNINEKGHGLGLYIVSYYASILKLEVKVKNVNEGVESVLYFK